MGARELVVVAICENPAMVLRRSNTVSALKNADEGTKHAITYVRETAMMMTVDSATAIAKSDVAIHDVIKSATKPVRHAFKAAPGLVRIKAVALCLVQRPAIGFRANNAVPRPFPAVISVRVSAKQDHRVDMLEFKSFGEIDLNLTPIVVLGCGHFFTAETLDGHMGMAKVYEMNLEGEFVGLQDISGSLVETISRCPDCQCRIQQYATQRYNRVINRAVIDEMSKRFLVSGQARLQALEKKADELELESEESRKKLLHLVREDGKILSPPQSLGMMESLKDRNKKFNKLAREVESFVNKIADKDQPVRKLHDATVKALRASRSISESMEKLAINGVPEISRDRRVILGSRVVLIKAQSVNLADRIELCQKLEGILQSSGGAGVPGVDLVQLATTFFESCENCITDCHIENLPKLNVETRLYYSRIAPLYQAYLRAIQSTNIRGAADYVKRAKKLLTEAQELCRLGFQNADGLQRAIEQTLHLLGKAWYEPMSADELAAVQSSHGQWPSRNCHPLRPLVQLPERPPFCGRRVRDADGAGTMPRVRLSRRRPKSRLDRRRDSCNADGGVSSRSCVTCMNHKCLFHILLSSTSLSPTPDPPDTTVLKELHV
ncbi:hypothetical protein MMC07_003000 [Pseudocyphellaria aurata]|nr:hypothetical protein [Pseudocyphellaria aurata]